MPFGLTNVPQPPSKVLWMTYSDLIYVNLCRCFSMIYWFIATLGWIIFSISTRYYKSCQLITYL
jgi:hypothetical protein